MVESIDSAGTHYSSALEESGEEESVDEPEDFKNVKIQDVAASVVQVATVIKSAEAQDKISDKSVAIQEKIKEIEKNSDEYLSLLAKLENIDREIEKLKSKVHQKADNYQELRLNYEATPEDTEIQRLIYKTNFTRQMALIILSTTPADSLEDAESLIKYTKKLSTIRDIDYYRDKVAQNETKQSSMTDG